MSVSFSSAALDRILAACNLAPTEGDAAESLLQLKGWWSSGASLPSGLPEFDDVETDIYGISDPVLTLLTVLGLIELGVTAGYLDLAELDESRFKSIDDVARSFADALPTDDPVSLPIDLTLFHRLLNRLHEQKVPATSADEQTFGGFEAYVDLTSFIWSDEAFKRFLIQTHDRGPLDDDLSFLVSARHFAAALATGHVGEMRTLEVAGGFDALRYLDWFRNILDTVAHAPDLYDGLIRHARWSHGIATVQQRLDRWADTMAEWPSERDVIGEQTWAAYGDRVFRSLAADQSRLGVQLVFEPSPSTVAASGAAVYEAAKNLELPTHELVEEGRAGAARRLATATIASQRRDLSYASDWDRPAVALVQSCIVLANLGDTDTAAAYLAPVLVRLKARLKSGNFKPKRVAELGRAQSERAEVNELLERGMKIVVQARRDSPTQAVEAVHVNVVSPPRSVVTQEDARKKHSIGGSTNTASTSET